MVSWCNFLEVCKIPFQSACVSVPSGSMTLFYGRYPWGHPVTEVCIGMDGNICTSDSACVALLTAGIPQAVPS